MICILQRTSQNLLSKNFSSGKRFIKKNSIENSLVLLQLLICKPERREF